jgi:RNA polymerase sigma factor for flagellar operon FliA
MVKGSESMITVDDLISAGIVGLLEVVQRYDPDRETKLNTYAYLRIRGAMIDELRSRDWFPRSVRSKAKRIKETIRKLEHKLGRKPDDEEVAREMHVELCTYYSMLKEFGSLSVISIDGISDPVAENRNSAISLTLDNDEDIEKYVELRQMRQILAEELQKLTERQRTILTRYYHEGANMKEIAGKLAITEARVSQIHAQTIADLKLSMNRHLKEVHFKQCS